MIIGNMIKEEQNKRCQKEWLDEFIDRLMWIQEEIKRTCINKIKKNFALHLAVFTRALQPFRKCPCAT